MVVKSSVVEHSMLILMFFDRKYVQDQAVFLIGDKSLGGNDQARIFVNSFVK